MKVDLTLNEFIENVMRSCLMDIAGITPVYVYMMRERQRCNQGDNGFAKLRI